MHPDDWYNGQATLAKDSPVCSITTAPSAITWTNADGIESNQARKFPINNLPSRSWPAQSRARLQRVRRLKKSELVCKSERPSPGKALRVWCNK